MCALPKWADEERRFTLDDLKRAFRGLKDELTWIGVSGGESTLREDLPELFEFLFTMNSGIGLVSNGFNPEKLKMVGSFTPEQKTRFWLGLSIDGLEETHDKIRCKGSFKNVMQSIKLLKTTRALNRAINLNICIQPLNYKELLDVYQLSLDLGCNFFANLAVPFENFNWTPEMLDEIEKGIHKITSEIKGNLPDRRVGKYIIENMMPHMRTGKRPIPCCAGEEWIILDPFGDIYPCHKASWDVKGDYGNQEYCFGNIKKDGTIIGIYMSERAYRVREKLDVANCNFCWGCDVGVNPHLREALQKLEALK